MPKIGMIFGQSSATAGFAMHAPPCIVPHALVASSAQQAAAPMPANIRPEHVAVPHITEDIITWGVPPSPGAALLPALEAGTGGAEPAVLPTTAPDSSAGALLPQPTKSAIARHVAIHRCIVFLMLLTRIWLRRVFSAVHAYHEFAQFWCSLW